MALVEPKFVSMPDWHATLGPEVAAIATLAGFPPDPEQQLLLDAAFAVDKRGKSVAFEVVVIAPRQNLKTGFEKQYALGQLFVRQEPLTVWSAHEFGTAAESLNDVEALIGGSDFLRRRVKLTNRGEVARRGAVPEIRLLPQYGNARLIFKTRTSGGGRGLSGRKVILDEGYALQAGQVGALMPIMLAQPDPQVVIGSSACRPESEVLWDIVRRGRRGGDPRMAYAEWCAPAPDEACARGSSCDHMRETEGCGCDKPELYRKAHSAITRGRIMVQSITDLRKSIPPAEFTREVMGWHDQPEAGRSAIDYVKWSELDDPNSRPVSPTCFAVAVSLDREWASIAVAGEREDGLRHVQVIEHRRGVDWIVGRGRELAERHGWPRFLLDGAGPAATVAEGLTDAGMTVVEAATGDVAQAFSLLTDAINERQLRHRDASASGLDDAARTAKERACGDGGSTVGRRASGSDISPLEAVQLAHWGLMTDGGGVNLW